jgi:hypothetical protein
MEKLTTEILVVGGGTGGVAAALQAARRGRETILVSEYLWLGGMLTTAGVCAPDGNELAAWQTGIWGEFLRTLRQQQSGGLDNSWVSLFTYDPRNGAKIFADWVQALPNLHWIIQQIPLEVHKQGNQITRVRFADYLIQAQVILDGTELGDVLALGEVPHRWGWEWQGEWNEPSAPVAENTLTQTHPVQSPTWVAILQDFDETAPPIPPPPNYNPDQYEGAWTGYTPEQFLSYGGLPDKGIMLNWPQQGNDYGMGVERLVQGDTARQAFLQEAYWQTQGFAHFIQTHLGRNYGFAENIFPHNLGNSAFAFHPYYRESRRLVGQETVTELDILPVSQGQVAPLPLNQREEVTSIAIGNYANDHHYRGFDFPLQPKSLRWGGRWTGTPFTIPYGSLVPKEVTGLLVCEKNISVSHIANGATRLQPLVLNIGQAAGMAAALCVEKQCQPQELSVRELQEALLRDKIAPSGVIPLFNLTPDHPEWLQWQRYYLDHSDLYPPHGYCPCQPRSLLPSPNSKTYTGLFQRRTEGEYSLQIATPQTQKGETWALITTQPEVDQWLESCQDGDWVTVQGVCNQAGGWLQIS